MNTESAYDVAKQALRLADERRWRELVALVDEDALERYRRDAVRSEESRIEARKQPLRSDMPDEVRKWHEEQYARHRQQDRLEDRYADVASLDELRALDAAELLVRELEAQHDDVGNATAYEPRLIPFAREIAAADSPRRQPIGAVPDGPLAVHVLYRIEDPPMVDVAEPAVLSLHLTERGWRLLPKGELFVASGWTAYPVTVHGTVGEDPSPRAVRIEQMPWVERTFPSGLPAGLLAPLLGRFEGNLQRLHMLVHSVSHGGRTTRPSRGGWSIQEHAGHLLELERLGEVRLGEFERGVDVLSPADMSNRATKEAGYNQRTIEEIVSTLFEMRFEMMTRLQRLTREQLEHAALHPRLQQPMNVMDWLFFMCEHDDHHLAHMQRLKEEHVNALLHPQS